MGNAHTWCLVVGLGGMRVGEDRENIVENEMLKTCAYSSSHRKHIILMNCHPPTSFIATVGGYIVAKFCVYILIFQVPP